MYKKILTILFFLFFFLPVSFLYAEKGYEVSLVDMTQDEIILDFNLGAYSIETVEKDGQIFNYVDFPGKVTTNEKGFPELPFLNASVVLPDTANFTVEVVSKNFKDLKTEFPVLPSRGTIYRNQDPSKIPYKISKKALRKKWYPKKLVTSGKPFILRDVRGANIYVFPFRYNALKKKLRVFENMRIKVKIDSSSSTNSLVKKSKSVVLPMENLYRDMFINYSPKRSIGESGEILVIYTQRDASAIAPYIQWKLKKGFKVYSMQVSTGTNVKNTISQFYSNHPNLLYVQLVGDWADIKSDLGTSANAPMDPMLGCVAGNDNYPDLIIGRFSASSSQDVTTQVNKTVNYEKNPDLSGTWYPKGLGIGSNEGSGSGDDGEADYQHIDIIKENRLLPFGYTTVHEVYQSGSASTVAGHVNSGLSIINYCGHGSQTSWGTTGFSNSSISSLSNGSMLPVIISVACVNGKFNAGSDCFAEAWLKKSGGGAAATIMSTINQPWQPPMRGQDYMNDFLTGGYDYSVNPGSGTSTSQKRTTFGSITFNGLILMYAESSGSSDLETLQTWTVFGDASLQIRTKQPSSINVSNTNISPNTTYNTTITSSGNPVEGAVVSLEQNGTVFSQATDSSGNAVVSHSFSAGTVNLTVSGYNLETKTYQVNLGGSANQNPSADFNYSVNNLAVTFTDASTDSDGTIVSWSWDFGDGSTSSDQNTSHTYSQEGTYNVALAVTDNEGAQSQSIKSVTASLPGPATPEIQNGESISNLSGAQGDWIYYVINIPSGASGLEVTITGGSGDADLYTRFNERPDESNYDCRPYKWGNEETCSYSSPAQGECYIGIKGYSEFSGLTLSVNHN